MATTKSTVREWSTPEKTKITGEPPGPDARVSHTSRGEFRRQDLRVVTPIYKAQPLTTNAPGGGTSVHVKSEIKVHPDSHGQYPDYKIEKEHESYRLHIIDPKVDSRYRPNSPMFNNLPAYMRKRNKTPDFPSAHSKRSFLKTDALENKRLRSYETKIISPHEYLAESVQRHRAVSMSPLRDRLNLKDRDVNLPWDPASHPGPRVRQDPWLLKHQLIGSTSNAKKTEMFKDLDDLAKRRERLLDRSKNRSALNIHELRRVDPNYIDVPERESFEDSLESKVDYSVTRSSKSSGTRDLFRSQSVMSADLENYDKGLSKTRSQTNLASWQFNSASFSPRSVINVNGHQNDTGLLRIRTDLSPAPTKFNVQPILQKSNAGVQTQTKTEQVTSTVVNQPQQPPYWNMPPGVMPQIVFVPVATTGSAPNTLTRETVKEEKIRYVRDYDQYPSDTDSKQGTLIRIKDETSKKPPSTAKNHRRRHVVKQERYGFELEGHDENMAENENRQVALPRQRIVQEVVQPIVEPKVTETVSTVEETKRTEEVERRVKAETKKQHKHKQHRSRGHQHHRSQERHLEDGYQQQERIGYHHGQNGHVTGAVDYPPWKAPFGESKTTVTGSNGYHPSVTENYQRQTTTKRIQDGDLDGTLRSRYENGVPYQGQDRIHRSYSSTNVHHNGYPESQLYYEDNKPIVEYPPSLQRDTGNGAAMDDRFYNRHGSRHLGRHGRRWDSELGSSGQGTPQKTDYKDSLLMPVPGGNINEKEYRREVIPGGHETFSRTLKSQSGARNDANFTTQFSEAKQESNLRRETSEKKY